MENSKKILLSLLIPVFLWLIKPLGFNSEQALVFGIFVLVIFWWGTGLVNQNIASLVLLGGFLLCGSSPSAVLAFPSSQMFFLILASYLLTAGIVNSGVAEQISYFLLERYCKSLYGLIGAAFLLNIVLLFLIPQPFPRVLIIGEIYKIALKGAELRGEQRKAIFYSIFVAGSVTTLLFFNGDVLANYVAFELGGLEMDSIKWMKYMTVPGLIATVAVGLGFPLVFGKQLAGDFQQRGELPNLRFSRQGKRAGWIMGAVACLWISQPLHGIEPAYVALGGALAMMLASVIETRDFKKININILIFMTAQFAVGKAFVEMGITEKLNEVFVKMIPSANSVLYLPVIVLILMALHMLLGSIVTVMSVTVPTLLMITAGVIPPEIAVFLVCVSTYFHIMLPYHQVTVMVGFQQGYYDTSLTVKFGWYLTVLTVFLALFVYLPWWKIIGAI